MSYPSFPTLSRGQDQRYYSEKPHDPAIRAPIEGGYEWTRPRFTRRPPMTYTTGFTDISNADKQAVEAFWNQVRGGSNAFLWRRPTDGAEILVRFAGEIEFAYAHVHVTTGGAKDHRWDVSKIVLKEV